jgi:hypothetical protein
LFNRFIEANVTYLFRAWVDYTFRRRMPGFLLLSSAVTLVVALLAGFALDVRLPTPWGRFHVNFTTGNTPTWLYVCVFGIVAIFIALGLYLIISELRAERRRRVVAIELRGLRDTSGCPLMKAIPRTMTGRREQILVNLRQGQDGNIGDPAAAIRRIEALPHEISAREEGFDRADFTYILGGLAPVPFSFLTGILTDDECAVTLMDWDRHTNRWSPLELADDRKRFTVIGLDTLAAQTDAVAVAVSVSYAIDTKGVAQKCPGIPLVEMTLQDGNPDAHWSEEKQAALGRQFLEALIALGNIGVRTVHLFLAAPNSVVLRFGRLYDKRNLPALIVYQYERREVPPFPWGIRMPVEGRPQSEVVT